MEAIKKSERALVDRNGEQTNNIPLLLAAREYVKKKNSLLETCEASDLQALRTELQEKFPQYRRTDVVLAITLAENDLEAEEALNAALKNAGESDEGLPQHLDEEMMELLVYRLELYFPRFIAAADLTRYAGIRFTEEMISKEMTVYGPVNILDKELRAGYSAAGPDGMSYEICYIFSDYTALNKIAVEISVSP